MQEIQRDDVRSAIRGRLETELLPEVDPVRDALGVIAVGHVDLPDPDLEQRIARSRRSLVCRRLRLQPFALGDIPGQGHDEPAATLPEPSAPDLDREHRPVLAPVAGFERDLLLGVASPHHILHHGGGEVGVELETGSSRSARPACIPGSGTPGGSRPG